MKSKGANMGLGDARAKQRRNGRINIITKATWAVKRVEFFKHNVRFAAAAKATRTALEVSQQEVAVYFGVSQGAVCCWESGKYSWANGEKELFEYMSACRAIAGV